MLKRAGRRAWDRLFRFVLAGDFSADVFAPTFDRDAQGTQKVQVIGGEGAIVAALIAAGVALVGLFGGHFVQADGRLQHQQDVEPVAADILHHTGDLLALNDRLMDGLAELLDQFA
jgi:hypothetical protein